MRRGGARTRALAGRGRFALGRRRGCGVHRQGRTRAGRIAAREQRVEPRAQPRDARRQLVAARGRLAEPERDVRRLPVRILDAHAPRLDPDDPVRLVAELEHVAREAFDREILVDGADVHALRLEQHRVVGVIGNRAARGDGREPRAAPPAHRVRDDVAVQVRGARAAPAREALGEHLQHLVERLARERRVGRGLRHAAIERVLVPFAAGDFGDELLREHVERRARNAQHVEFAAPHAIEERRAFDEFVARQRKEPPLRHAADMVPGAPDALQERRDAARRAELADELDVADVDAELERGRGDEQLEFAVLQALLGVEAMFLREAAVVRGDRVRAEPVRQMAGRALGHPARVDEHERRAVRGGQLRDAIVEALPHVVRHHGPERHGRQFQREIARARVAGVDDRAIERRVVAAADEKARDRLDRLLRRGQPDARQLAADERVEPLERQREMAAALGVRERVDFVDDHGARAREHAPARFGRQQHVQRFRGRDENVRRVLAMRDALGLGRVAGAHGGADLRHRQPAPRDFGGDAGERRFEVHVNVVRQRFQRRHVDDERLVGQRAIMRERVAHEIVERGQECGERLAGARRRGDERRAAGLDVRPRERLRAGGRGERVGEPGGDDGVERVERAGGRAGGSGVHR
ncbi:Uncharacterised protein [Burkholderia pseudomallei]|nr:Uncharacterised protein [Burkholderia pseudomallei]CAJ3355255.1 Uncharacterised protein [Burkholderia pseudomallei]CAJ5870893.1 Uncharacterised protein [Burkholderia pseudomallei]CAK0601712.1 Uncharacterised protein [Burkholderia pseudomallei]VBN80901.1 Uncharacterised protein [Burkholderia pseudomallei]